MAAILLAAGLAMLATCRERPAPPKPVAHKPPAPPVNLPNYRKALLKMQRMAHEPPDMARARRSMPGLIARAEMLYLKNAGSAAACAAWDKVAANAMAQNDAALVHIWGVLADQRCGAAGLETRYWQAAPPDAGSRSGGGNRVIKAPR